MLECVVNISEGRDEATLGELSSACGADLLDVHADPFHNRSVFTMVGVDAPRRLSRAAVSLLDLRTHAGVHPRIGVVDVVPFVPLRATPMAEAIAERDAFAAWAADELGLPCFRYGSERSLPEVRRHAFSSLQPDFGPPRPHLTAGACAVGARSILVAYNVWVSAPDLHAVKRVAAAVRSSEVRTLGLMVGERFQVSCNLIEPDIVGPHLVVERVATTGAGHGVSITGTELVGLVPERVLDAVEPSEWDRLDLSRNRTIEARLARARLTSRRQGPLPPR